MKRVASMFPMAQLAQPEEIAHPPRWLRSDAARYVTGAPLAFDGGIACKQARLAIAMARAIGSLRAGPLSDR